MLHAKQVLNIQCKRVLILFVQRHDYLSCGCNVERDKTLPSEHVHHMVVITAMVRRCCDETMMLCGVAGR